MAWANEYGPLNPGEVTASQVEPADTGAMASAWDGVFTDAQAGRGEAVYEGACGLCHGRRLSGAPDDPDMRSSTAFGAGPVPPHLGRKIACRLVRMHASDHAGRQSRLFDRAGVCRRDCLHAHSRRNADGRRRTPTGPAEPRPGCHPTTAMDLWSKPRPPITFGYPPARPLRALAFRSNMLSHPSGSRRTPIQSPLRKRGHQ